MKINTNGSNLKTNNFNAESIEFGIGDVSTIIDILRNRLYANPIRTLTQEYLCNARDSHRDSGNRDTPVSVTLPTKLDSVLKIRDYGTGLSPERVKDVFVNYGSSTKRADNVQTGGFGIGAKSAWAYTDSFTVLSYYNGKLRSYIAHTGKNSNGTLELISEDDTNEPNGVEVQIPIRESDIEQFVYAVYRCTFFWDVKPELKGITKLEIPASWLDPSKNIDFKNGNWFILHKDEFIKRLFDAYQPDIFVLIDKIPYSINKFTSHELSANVNALRNSAYASHMSFVEVDNGVLEISATRESVSDKDDSKKKVNNICGDAIKSLVSCVEDELGKDFDTIEEYIKFYFSVKCIFNFVSLPTKLEFAFKKDGFDYKYNSGRLVSTSFDGCRINKYHLKQQKTRSVLKIEENHPIEIDQALKSCFILDDGRNPRYTIKEKIKKYFADNQGIIAVYCIEGYTADQQKRFTEHLGAKYMLDLPHNRVSYKQKREAGKISYREIMLSSAYSSKKLASGTKKDVTLDEIESSSSEFVVVPFSSEEMYHDETFEDNVKFIINHGKYTVIKCSKKDYDSIVGSADNVHTYEDVIESFPDYIEVDDKAIESFVYRQASNTLDFMRKFIDRVECPKLKEYFEIKGGIKDVGRGVRTDIPDRIISIYPQYAAINGNLDKMNKLENEINSKYPLLRCLSTGMNYGYGYYGHGHDRDEAGRKNKEMNDLVFYINSKSKANQGEKL
jgi:hypothetical protein